MLCNGETRAALARIYHRYGIIFPFAVTTCFGAKIEPNMVLFRLLLYLALLLLGTKV